MTQSGSTLKAEFKHMGREEKKAETICCHDEERQMEKWWRSVPVFRVRVYFILCVKESCQEPRICTWGKKKKKEKERKRNVLYVTVWVGMYVKWTNAKQRVIFKKPIRHEPKYEEKKNISRCYILNARKKKKTYGCTLLVLIIILSNS